MTPDLDAALAEALRLRPELNGIPEKSGCERRTKARLVDYIKKATDLEIHDRGRWFYCAHREGDGLGSVALRADMDAVTGPDGQPYHGCGHDGHMSVMAALAKWLSGRRVGKNVFFLFQHAEENGRGAAECCGMLDDERIDRIYGFHNCPGFKEGAAIILKKVFACASNGLIIKYDGLQSHAAYPDNGKNPIFPMAELFGRWGELTGEGLYRGMTLITPVGMTAGSESFGVAAGSGEIYLTLRAWYDDDLEKLERAVRELSSRCAEKYGVRVSFEERDGFAATVNSPALCESVVCAAERAGLECVFPDEPMRWSEDFGRYGRRTDAFMLGIGAGENAAGLHTADYRWNDAVSRAAIPLFINILTDDRQKNESEK